MWGEIVVYVAVGIVLVGIALVVWILDARRNEEVEHDEERLDTDTGETEGHLYTSESVERARRRR